MPVSIVVGGQFGSEGKGKVASWIAQDPSVKIAVRCGGPNSGHTVIHNGKPEIFRQLPTACLNPNVTSVLSAGTYIDPEILFEEIDRAEITPDRLFIDPNAVIITGREQTGRADQRPERIHRLHDQRHGCGGHLPSQTGLQGDAGTGSPGIRPLRQAGSPIPPENPGPWREDRH